MEKTEAKKECAVILHDVRSVHNVGSIFRTADAAGVRKIYLTGYTPTPTDRFRRVRKDLAKVALGAEKSMPWEKRENPEALIAELRRDGYRIIAVEQSSRAVDYKKITLPEKTAIVFGNEIGGIPEEILGAADVIAEISMRGQKESLNVSVSAGIALFRLLNV